MQARRGELVDVLEGDGLAAALDAVPIGILTWLAAGRTAEVRAVAVAPEARGQGVGRALHRAAASALRSGGVARAWLVTTKDNHAALALYQKEGWRLAALRVGALDELRGTIKPSLPTVGEHGIPFHDELELVRDLLGE